ncbi:hypothetical protein [Inquilinus limosus]|uniref:Uncharacterized protein n=1 Tax=Inquilinus limosus MP06 TaxID=1398085 RepID=A0A0A0DD35_9PROT|nr:hypothetical protein [Inquilinus limosus]KGM36049.1 hypothetical protein P409_00805 [Inquilinus limosus MP06]
MNRRALLLAASAATAFAAASARAETAVEIPAWSPVIGQRIAYQIQMSSGVGETAAANLPPAEFGDYIEHATVLAHTDTGYTILWELSSEISPGADPFNAALGIDKYYGINKNHKDALSYFGIDQIEIKTDLAGVPEMMALTPDESYVSGENRFDSMALQQQQLRKSGRNPLESIVPQAFLLGHMQARVAGPRIVGSHWSSDTTTTVGGSKVPVQIDWALKGIDERAQTAKIVWSGQADPAALAAAWEAGRSARAIQQAILDGLVRDMGAEPADPFPEKGRPAASFSGSASVSLRDGSAITVRETVISDDGRMRRATTTVVTRLDP